MSERQIRKLQLDKNDSNSYFFPATHYKAVYGDSGKTLDQELGEIWGVLNPLTISASTTKSVFNEVETIGGTITVTLKRGSTPINHKDEVKSVTATGSIDILPEGEWEIKTGNITRPFRFDHNLSGYQTKSLTIAVTLNDGTTKSASVTISEIARSYVGFLQIDSVSSGMSLAEQTYIGSKQSTSLAGFTKKYDSVPEGYTFWIIVPSSSKFTAPTSLKVTSGGFDVSLVKDGDWTYNGVPYTCYKNTQGKTNSDQTWNIKIE